MKTSHDLALLFWLRTVLKDYLKRSSLLRLYCNPASPPAWSCFFLSPPLSFPPWQRSQEHPLINLLHTSLYLRVCFLGNLTCDNYYPSFEDGKPKISDTKLIAWIHHLMRWTQAELRPSRRHSMDTSVQARQGTERWIRAQPIGAYEGGSNTNTNTVITCLVTNTGSCVRHENGTQWVMSAGCVILQGEPWRHSRETARKQAPAFCHLPWLHHLEKQISKKAHL